MVDRRDAEAAGGWRMPDGRVLVPGPIGPMYPGSLGLTSIFGVPDEPGEPDDVAEGVRPYYALDAFGAVDRVYSKGVYSVEDELYVTVYRVEDDTLYAHHSWSNLRYAESRHERSVECAGLIRLPPARVPSPESVAAALAELAEREQAEVAARRSRLEAVGASFLSTLPDHTGDGVLHLELTLEEWHPVIRLSDGRVLWRAAATDLTHKELLTLLRAVLAARYGEGPVRVTPSPEIVASEFWDPWN
ncbi:hypothetical protein AB0B89_28820 [Sphaerisporangium sp. NPDC049002]|uniref:hypothetical protein n=1 Tax=Sphaerisporangium sp. NPDC049002 TaxID=3155392 RepID=UPI0033EEC11E